MVKPSLDCACHFLGKGRLKLLGGFCRSLFQFIEARLPLFGQRNRPRNLFKRLYKRSNGPRTIGSIASSRATGVGGGLQNAGCFCKRRFQLIQRSALLGGGLNDLLVAQREARMTPGAKPLQSASVRPSAAATNRMDGEVRRPRSTGSKDWGSVLRHSAAPGLIRR